MEAFDDLLDHSDCYIEQFEHKLPHRGPAETRKCGHSACEPHTIKYYGTGDDPEAVGDYCMVCFGIYLEIWPDKTLKQSYEEKQGA